jgi:hypothetical protein
MLVRGSSKQEIVCGRMEVPEGTLRKGESRVLWDKANERRRLDSLFISFFIYSHSLGIVSPLGLC